MNSRGVAAFYGANLPDAALAGGEGFPDVIGFVLEPVSDPCSGRREPIFFDPLIHFARGAANCVPFENDIAMGELINHSLEFFMKKSGAGRGRAGCCI